ncbi:hypothetical protein NVP1170O_095 [Vibrio phage 1.170.O._10N.261.52.C3]|nr:hypothetical protein NVP1170O_095 [Vibrio phage 1.170.O._10N.261.52.C3]
MSDHMEQRMQEQIESGILRMEALHEEFELFREWYLSIPDADETLVEWEYFSSNCNLESPSNTANSFWVGWRAAKGL